MAVGTATVYVKIPQVNSNAPGLRITGICSQLGHKKCKICSKVEILKDGDDKKDNMPNLRARTNLWVSDLSPCVNYLNCGSL